MKRGLIAVLFFAVLLIFSAVGYSKQGDADSEKTRNPDDPMSIFEQISKIPLLEERRTNIGLARVLGRGTGFAGEDR